MEEMKTDMERMTIGSARLNQQISEKDSLLQNSLYNNRSRANRFISIIRDLR